MSIFPYVHLHVFCIPVTENLWMLPRSSGHCHRGHHGVDHHGGAQTSGPVLQHGIGGAVVFEEKRWIESDVN